MVVGISKSEMFLASNLAAFHQPRPAGSSTRVTAISPRSPHRRRVCERAHGAVPELVVTINWTTMQPSARGTDLHAQGDLRAAQGVAETIGDRVRHGHRPEGLGVTEEELHDLQRIVIVACGTTYHAGVVGATRSRNGRASYRARCCERWIYRNPSSTRHAGHRHRGRERPRHDPGDEARARRAPAPSRSRT